MKYKSAITKPELLVTLVCIVLALFNLGGLNSAGRERARRMVCAANMAQLMRANHMYADNWDEQFCPPMMMDEKMPNAEPPLPRDYYQKVNWLTNPDFRKFMGLDEKQDAYSVMVMPKEYQCPTNILFKKGEPSSWDVLVSYAYNVTDWSAELSTNYWDYATKPGGSKNWQIGYKRTAIPSASEKINFVESSDWWAVWMNGANYIRGWDIVGQGDWEAYSDVGFYGPTLYRHNEGGNFAFYDGHVEYLPKEKAFIDTDGDLTNGDMKDATGMWYVEWPD